MKKLILFCIAFIAISGCKKVELPESKEATLLTVKAQFSDTSKRPIGYVYLYDATENDLAEKQSAFDGITIGIAKDVNGKDVKPIAIESLMNNDLPNGKTSDYTFALFNLDNEMYYTTRESGQIMVVIVLSKTDKYTYKIIKWSRGKSIEVTKIFDTDRPALTFEAW